MRSLIVRLLAFCLVAGLLALPQIAARAGHPTSMPAGLTIIHDHDAHSREGNHQNERPGLGHDRGLDTARCALACAGLPVAAPVIKRPEQHVASCFRPLAGGWIPLSLPPRLERPPKPLRMIA